MNSRKYMFDYLSKEVSRLSRVITDAEKRLKAAPSGCVHIKKHRNGVQYFHTFYDAGSRREVYIPASGKDKADSLIQKGYDAKMLPAAIEQLSVIERFLKEYNPDSIRNIYASLPEIKKVSVIPAELPDKEYAALWQVQPYESKSFSNETAEHFTDKGERVRSKSEVMIANALGQAGIPYRYEYPLQLGDDLIYPDFTILRLSDRKEIRWEHFGMMDDPAYCLKAIRKIRSLEKSGFCLGMDYVFTMETSQLPINLSVIKDTIEHYCR